MGKCSRGLSTFPRCVVGYFTIPELSPELERNKPFLSGNDERSAHRLGKEEMISGDFQMLLLLIPVANPFLWSRVTLLSLSSQGRVILEMTTVSFTRI